jgi:hypothetical protein
MSLILALFLLGSWATLATDACTWAAERPNIVFILIDDFGNADSGPYGAKDIHGW